MRAQSSAIVIDELGGLVAGSAVAQNCGYGQVYHAGFGKLQEGAFEKFNLSKRILATMVRVSGTTTTTPPPP